MTEYQDRLAADPTYAEREKARHAAYRAARKSKEQPLLDAEEEPEVYTSEDVKRLRSVTHTLQRQLRDAKAKTGDYLDALREAVLEAYVIEGPYRPVPAPVAKGGKEEVALLHVTDWQVGKMTYSFNTEVAKRRVLQLAQTAERLTEIERMGHPVNRLVLVISGDMIENVCIFPGQVWEVDSSLFEQMFAVQGMLRGLIAHMLRVFPIVEVVTEPGNHGRLGKKNDGIFHPRDNGDNIVYENVHQYFSEEPRLLWHSKDDWYNHFTVGNYSALVIHGDEINNFQGQTPLFAIKKKCDSWSTGVVAPFKDVYIGHFHQPFSLPLANGSGRIFGTPSIESDNQFAARVVAATGRPAQRFHMIDPRHGRVTAERLIWLD
jgi:hypothetical protein